MTVALSSTTIRHRGAEIFPVHRRRDIDFVIERYRCFEHSNGAGKLFNITETNVYFDGKVVQGMRRTRLAMTATQCAFHGPV